MSLLRTDDASLAAAAAGIDTHVASLTSQAAAFEASVAGAQAVNIGETSIAFQAAGARALEALHILIRDAGDAAQLMHTQAVSYSSEDSDAAGTVAGTF